MGRAQEGAAAPTRRILPQDVEFGTVLSRAPDLDRDGCDDLLVGDPGSLATDHDPRVWVMSGRNGFVLATRRSAEYTPGRGLACGSGADVDGDGVFDWAFSCGYDEWGGHEESHVVGRVIVVSGATGADLAVIDAPEGVTRFGTKLALSRARDAGAELLVRARDALTGEALVTVFSARDGRCRRTLRTRDEVVDAGVVFVPDRDGDGRLDLLGARRDTSTGELVLETMSTLDERVVAALRWPASADTRYYQLATSPDLDGDRIEDAFLVHDARVECRLSARSEVVAWDLPGTLSAESLVVARDAVGREPRVVIVADSSFGIAQGRVEGRDPWSGDLLWGREGGEDDWHLGQFLMTIGDADRDGVEDVAVGNYHVLSGQPGRFSVLSGRTGRILRAMRRRGALLGHA